MAGVKSGKNKLDVKATEMTLDTGLTYVMVPPEDLQVIGRDLKESLGFSCAKEGPGDLDMYECDCTKE